MKNSPAKIANSQIPIPALTYHRLHKGAAPIEAHLRAFSIAVEKFKDQMLNLLDAGYTPVSLDTFALWRSQISDIPEKPVLVTFDDGWASNLVLANPFLKSLNIPWTVFVVADRNAGVFKEGGNIDRALIDNEIIELSLDGVSIQSHGLSHEPFTELPDYKLRWELSESRSRLEALIDRPVRWLASPYGVANRKTFSAAKDAGYIGFASGTIGSNKIYVESKDKLIDLKRIGVSPEWSGDELLNKISHLSITKSSAAGNLKRRVRLFLGYERSKRLRELIRK